MIYDFIFDTGKRALERLCRNFDQIWTKTPETPGEEAKNGDMRMLETGLNFSPVRPPFLVVKKISIFFTYTWTA